MVDEKSDKLRTRREPERARVKPSGRIRVTHL
ncbi:hypothetical protein V1293_005299 [Bradyrhizobium sp. AZCC 1693]